MEELFFLVIGLLTLGAPVMAIVALVQISKLKKQLASQGQAIAALRARQDKAPTGDEKPEAEKTDSVDAKPQEAQRPPATKPIPETRAIADDKTLPWTPPTGRATPPKERVAPVTADKTRTSWLEEALAFRWLVWLGGATLALGGVFFVQYSLEHGLISPLVRIALAIGLGGVLVFAGEWFRRRPLRKAIAAIRPDYIPAAITAAGVAILYGGVYAGYALYDLFAPLAAFGLLTLVSLLALSLSLVQGPLIAALGLVGSYAVPLLIGSEEPNYWGLFSYLTVSGAAVLAIVHLRHWWWAALSVLVGSGLWAAVAIPFAVGEADLIPVALFILLVFGGLLSLTKILRRLPAGKAQSQPGLVLYATAVATAGLLFGLGLAEGNGAVSLTAMAVFTLVACYTALRQPVLEGLARVPALMGLAVLLCWALPETVYQLDMEPFAVFGRLPTGGTMSDLWLFLGSAAVFAVFYTVAGHLALARVAKPSSWALLSAAVPVVTLAIVYYRCQSLLLDLGWAAIGLVLAAILVALATRLHRSTQSRNLELGVGLYAVAAIGAISLAATMTLSEVWLSIALVLQLPALAWVNGSISLPYSRHVALVIGGIVFVRQILLHTLFGTSFEVPADTAWIFYGYGVPALAYFFAARWFHQERDSRTVHCLEGFALAAAVLTVSLEIRYWVNGSLLISHYGLLEQSLQSACWLASALGFHFRYQRMPRPVAYWGARVLGLMAVTQIGILQLIINNPLFTGESVGSWPVFNTLLLAYGVPAGFAAAFAWIGWREKRSGLLWFAGWAALFFAFLNLTLEVRHWFQGEVIRYGSVQDAELYTYSACWLVFAGLLMLAGFWRHLPVLRKAALGIVLLTVVKVFVLDMAGLTGLYRVASFMGLGASLLLVGFLYQRFVLLPERAEAD